jgi:hypothetical protein
MLFPLHWKEQMEGTNSTPNIVPRVDSEDPFFT